MSDAIEAVLRGAGLTDKPGEFDSSIHSWRCEHPDVYGACDCFQELVRELAEVERAAAARALDLAASDWAADPDAWGDNEKDYRNELRARAAEIREGKSDGES